MTTPGSGLGVLQRIQEVLREHDGPYANADQTASACGCGWEGSDPQEPWTEHAAALIQESLGLTQEKRPRGLYRGDDPALKYEEIRLVSSWQRVP